MRAIPGVTVGDTSYLDDVVFKKDVPINWEQLAGDTADIAKNIDASIEGEEGGTRVLEYVCSKFLCFNQCNF